MQFSHHYAHVNGIRLHYVEAGSGPTVVLLHGFPETHRSFDLQLPELVERGYRVIAPDLRGYGESSRPRSGYELETLARDVTELCQHVSSKPVRLVGHDWGGAITWHIATHRPEVIERMVVLSCAHPALMERALLRNRAQVRKSWYMFFFQLPVLPELWLSRRGAAALANLFRQTPGAERAPTHIVDASRHAVGRVQSLAGPLAYYRTAIRRGAVDQLARRPRRADPRITLPVTLIWGEEDACFVRHLAEEHAALATDLTLHVLAKTGHFAHQEEPERVNALLTQALAGTRSVAAHTHG